MHQTINFQIEQSLARLTLNRPPLNIINISMMAEMVEVLETLKDQLSVHVLVIEAAEGSKLFSAGVDVADHTVDTVHDMIHGFHRVFRLLDELSIPTLAVVDGAALGGGCELAIFCDMIVASDRAKFGQPEIKVGAFPPIAAVLLQRLIPRGPAMELLLTGETISAADAYRLGLVNRVVPPEDLAGAANELIGKLTGLSSSILRYTRQAATLGASGSFDQALKAVETLYLDEMMQTHDAHEGLAAFMEKRAPVWQDK
ncbi:MAG TPA: enoyl-CoA hydratase-related protein [Anaerolineae bacterium]|jgi:cyclohexa-1,5-dienecarbonyl-CoA hydratase